jgi:hypothetical protein
LPFLKFPYHGWQTSYLPLDFDMGVIAEMGVFVGTLVVMVAEFGNYPGFHRQMVT